MLQAYTEMSRWKNLCNAYVPSLICGSISSAKLTMLGLDPKTLAVGVAVGAGIGYYATRAGSIDAAARLAAAPTKSLDSMTVAERAR